MEGHRDRDERREDRPADVGTEHHAAPVEAVREGSRGQAEDEVRERPEDSDDRHREAGARQCEHQDGQRRERDRVAERREALAEEHHLEVTIPGQRQVARVRRILLAHRLG